MKSTQPMIDQVNRIASKSWLKPREARDSFVMTVLFVHKSFSAIEVENCLEYIKGQLYELEKPNIAAQQMNLFTTMKPEPDPNIENQKEIYKELQLYIRMNKQSLTRK
tara:strand:- start:9 stop:332 length:324 start_codon:yes stop_codon:yes gene_type:complete